MNLYKLNSLELHLEAEKAARDFHRSEAYLLRVIEVVDARESYLELGFPSLFKFCTRILNLSNGVSYELIAVINKGKVVPEIKAAVLEGKVTLSKAKKICSVIDEDNFKEWIDLAHGETSKVIERCVALANPKECVKESAQYKSADRIEFKLGVSEEWIKALSQVKDLLSQKSKKAVDSEEALLSLMKEFIRKNDPVEKAERARARQSARLKLDQKREHEGDQNQQNDSDQKPKGEVQKQQFLRTVASEKTGSTLKKKSARKPLRRIAIHEVNLRDGNQCTFTGKAGRCDQRRWLDVHHIVHVADGGSNETENLTTLCQAHHQLLHKVGSGITIRNEAEWKRR